MAARGQDEGLLEREAELAWLGRLLDAVIAGEGRVVLVEGEPGIGKSRLVDVFAAHASALGVRALRGRGARLERAFAFGVARQLLGEPLAGLQHDGLTGVAARAPAVLDGTLTVSGGLYAQVDALYWALVPLAQEAPLLLCVDDAQWADESTVIWLGYCARRLEGLPIMLTMCARGTEGGEALETLREDPATEVIRPAALSADAIETLLADQLGAPSPELTAACKRASGGNPFLMAELIAELHRATEQTAEAVAELRPASVARSVRVRLGRVGDEGRALARAVAVLGDGTRMHHAADLAGIDHGSLGPISSELADASLLARTGPLGFVHPMIRDAVYEQAPAAQRAAEHGRAAALLRRAGAPQEAIAAQLLRSEPAGDPASAAILLDAARAALDAGDPAAATALARRGLEEPAAADDRPTLLHLLGVAETLAGMPGAAAHLREAFPLIEDSYRRAEVAREVANALSAAGDVREAVTVLAEVAEGFDIERDRELRLSIEGDLATVSMLHADTFDAYGERVLALAPGLEGVTPGERLLLAGAAAVSQTHRAPLLDSWALAEAALTHGDLVSEQIPDGRPFDVCVDLGIDAERFDIVDRALDRAGEYARQRGSALGFAKVSAFRAASAWARGDLRRAESEAQAALRVALTGVWPSGLPLVAAFAIASLAERARVAEAEALLGELDFLDDPAQHQSRLWGFMMFYRARLRIAQGRVDEAIEELLALGDRVEHGPLSGQRWQWRTHVAPLLAGRGDGDRALALAEAELADSTGLPPFWEGTALRCLGLVRGGAEGIDLLERSVEVLAGSARRHEYARALVDLGWLLRREGHKTACREPLRLGLDVAVECDGELLAERARTELRASGLRPRRERLTGVAALTPSEARVARMAADGLTNAEIAQALFVTLKTVEKHLGATYAKLEVSRAELDSALSNVA